jgi:hypothetical protein
MNKVYYHCEQPCRRHGARQNHRHCKHSSRRHCERSDAIFLQAFKRLRRFARNDNTQVARNDAVCRGLVR